MVGGVVCVCVRARACAGVLRLAAQVALFPEGGGHLEGDCPSDSTPPSQATLQCSPQLPQPSTIGFSLSCVVLVVCRFHGPLPWQQSYMRVRVATGSCQLQPSSQVASVGGLVASGGSSRWSIDSQGQFGQLSLQIRPQIWAQICMQIFSDEGLWARPCASVRLNPPLSSPMA